MEDVKLTNVGDDDNDKTKNNYNDHDDDQDEENDDDDKVVGTLKFLKKRKMTAVKVLPRAKSLREESDESVRVADEALVAALAAVKKAEENVAKWDDLVALYLNNPDMWTKCRTSLNDAKKILDDARNYHLQLAQNARQVGYASTRFETRDPFFSHVGMVDEEDDMLTFPVPIPLTKRNTMYIRSCYSVIYEATIANEYTRKPKYAVVTGTPGIGKSSFLYYVFWRMVKANMRVYYLAKDMYFDGAKMCRLRTMPSVDDDPQFWTVDLWCLIDSADPTKIPGLQIDDCSILLITTPRHDYLSHFRTLVPTPSIFFMPLWSRDELERIAGLYPNPSSWEHRLTILGGVPRYVLEDVSKHPESLLWAACKECSLEDAIHMVSIDSEITGKTKVVQKLIHLNSKHPYVEAEVCYASQAAVGIIVNTHDLRDRLKVEALLSSAAGNPLVASLCGYIFEPYATKLLLKGGKFRCRELFAGRDARKGKAKKGKAKKGKAKKALSLSQFQHHQALR